MNRSLLKQITPCTLPHSPNGSRILFVNIPQLLLPFVMARLIEAFATAPRFSTEQQKCVPLATDTNNNTKALRAHPSNRGTDAKGRTVGYTARRRTASQKSSHRDRRSVPKPLRSSASTSQPSRVSPSLFPALITYGHRATCASQQSRLRLRADKAVVQLNTERHGSVNTAAGLQ